MLQIIHKSRDGNTNINNYEINNKLELLTNYSSAFIRHSQPPPPHRLYRTKSLTSAPNRARFCMDFVLPGSAFHKRQTVTEKDSLLREVRCEETDNRAMKAIGLKSSD